MIISQDWSHIIMSYDCSSRNCVIIVQSKGMCNTTKIKKSFVMYSFKLAINTS